MEFHRLHALVHDRVSSPVRRMDRKYVGLYVRGRRLLHSILSCYGSDRQSSRKYLVDTKFKFDHRLTGNAIPQNRFSIFS